MKFQLCSFCGAVLHHPGKYLLLKDELDKYEKYHSIRWNLCTECEKELFDRVAATRKRVIEEAENNTTGSGNCNCESCHSMIEF